MRTLFVECRSGAAGDMITAALSGLVEDRAGFERTINALGLPGVSFSLKDGKSHMISGTVCDVRVDGVEEDELSHGHDGHKHEDKACCGHSGHRHEDEACCGHDGHRHEDEACCGHDGHRHEDKACCCQVGHEHGGGHAHHHHHHHTAYSDVKKLITGLELPEKVKEDALSVYGIIADAESRVHGEPVSDIHFHEVGTADAVCDVVSACLLFHMIGAERVVVSPVCTGFGTVRTSHGILPVPAPATAEILKGMLSYAGNIGYELCTPTGAAILKYFADSFGERPLMRVDGSGTGIGHRDTGEPNVLRVFLGESSVGQEKVEEGSEKIGAGIDAPDQVTVYSFTVDDMTGEGIAFAAEAIRKAGALEVFETPVYMKKGRPGTLLTVLCGGTNEEAVEKAIFRHTSTIGVRKERQERLVMKREEVVRSTSLGDIRFKESEGFGASRRKAEYDDIAEAAERSDMSFEEAKRIIEDGQ